MNIGIRNTCVISTLSHLVNQRAPLIRHTTLLMDPPSSKCRHPDIPTSKSLIAFVAAYPAVLPLSMGPQFTMSFLRMTAWPLASITNLAKKLGSLLSCREAPGITSMLGLTCQHMKQFPTLGKPQDGDGSLSEHIYHEGKIIAVTKNCFAAIGHLSSVWEGKVLWLDAVCIDQDNIQGC